MSETPFTVSVSDDQLQLLLTKLRTTRLPDELDGSSWDYGVPLENVKRLVDRWGNGFDWRQVEAKINLIPQFTRDIPVEGFGSINIHYIHQKSTLDTAIPLLFAHGCR